MNGAGTHAEYLAKVRTKGVADQAQARAQVAADAAAQLNGHAAASNGATTPTPVPAKLAQGHRPDVNPIFLANHVYELRALKTKQATVSGYFDDPALLYQAAHELDGKVPAVYLTMNPVNPALLARAKNRIQTHAKTTTTDHDTLRRGWILIDCDAVRPSDISSTDAEHQAALDRCTAVGEWLTSHGWPEPVRADSGNGGHLLYRIDLPNDAESTTLVKACLEVLALRFDDHVVVVDKTVFNASRITKCYGTLTCKGDDIPERPHRRSRMLSIPEPIVGVSHALLAALAAQLPQDPHVSRSMNGAAFDLRAFMARHGLTVSREKPWNGHTLYELDTCPFNAEHVRSSSLIHFASGAMDFTCRHNSCSGYKWAELRARLEPARPKPSRPMAHAEAEASEGADSDGPVLVTLSDVQPEDVTWLWRGRIACSKLNLLIGPPGVGKSYESLDMAARHSRGTAWPDGQPCPCGQIILLGAEDGVADTIRPRLDVLGADVTRIHALTAMRERGTERGVDLSRDVETLRGLVQRTQATLVVIDPLSAYLGKIESYKDAEVRAVLAPLAKLAEDEGVAILAIMHLNKSTAASVMNRAAGSIAFVAAARTVLGIGLDPNDATRHLLMPIKSNVGVLPATLAFRIGPHGLTWETAPATDISPESVFGTPPPESADEKAGHQEARAFLRDLLADGGLPAEKVFTEGRKVGLSPSQIRRASHACHVVTRKQGFSTGWSWSLPDDLDDTTGATPTDDEEVLRVD